MSRSQYVTGLRAVEQLLAGDSGDVRRLYAEYQSANPRVEALIQGARQAGIEVQAANRARLAQMSGEARHQGVVAEVRRSTLFDEAQLRTAVEERLQTGDSPLYLVLDGIEDPHNLGACLRTAEAAAVDAVIVPRHRAARLGPTVSKVAAGAAERLPFVSVNHLGKTLRWMADYGIRIVGTSDRAESSLYQSDLRGAVALVMGREHSGLSKGVAERCTELVSLPMQGAVSSLNVSVATGICLYEIGRQRSAAAAEKA